MAIIYQVTPMSIIKTILWMMTMAVSVNPPAVAEPEFDLSDYRWAHRLLFIFAPQDADATFIAMDKRLVQSVPQSRAERPSLSG
jgi:hypothetical protein